MATVNKDFKIKSGLIVEGTNGTINGYDILTKDAADQSYIVEIAGGGGDTANTPNTIVKRDANGDFAAGTITAEDGFSGDLTGNVTGNVTGDVTGDVTGTVSSLSNHTTTDLAEGTNEYFTTTRARNAIQAGTGVNYDSATGTVSIDDTTTATKSYVDSEIGDLDLAAQGYANTAQQNAEDYADDLAPNYDPAGSAATAETNANTYTDNSINALDTDDIEEGTTNRYFLDSRAREALSGGEGITYSSSTGEIAVDTTVIATKNYVDASVSGLNWKQSVNLKSDANQNVAGDFVGVVIDGHAALDTNDAGYRILLTGQTTDSENGIWELSVSGATLVASRPADADTAAELIGAAVFILEGTTYGNTAWVQNDHYLTTFSGQDWAQFSGAGTYAAGNGLTLVGNEFAIDETITATKVYVDGEIDTLDTAAQGYANTAESNANGYTDGEITTALSTAQGYANTAESNANGYTDSAINALDTDDIEEGTANKYFTTDRATDAAGQLLADAVKTNIQITYDSETNALAITAENGVADSTTDDLSEGSTNLYFTNARAQSAVAGDISSAIDALDTDDIEEGTTNLYFTNTRAQDAVATDISNAVAAGDITATPEYLAINVNDVAKQVAATLSAPTAGIQTAYAWAKADYRSAEFLVKVAYGTHTEISKVLITLDTSDNIAITEYGIVGTNGSASSISADIGGSNVELHVTTNNNNSTVTVMGTLLV